MNSRKILILFLSLLTVSIYFNSTAVSAWYNERVGAFLNEIQDQVDYMTLEKRKLLRWGPSYESCTIMRDVIRKDKTKDPLILLPPASYGFKFMKGFTVVEPVIFYYYTGLRTTTREGKDLAKANYAITANANTGQPVLVFLRDTNELKNVLKEYQSKQPNR